MKTIIKGATMVYGSGLKREDMLIENGKIEAIKQCIRPSGEERMIDGTPYYALPGFLASETNELDAGEHGVTTYIRCLNGKNERNQSTSSDHFPFDFVFQSCLEQPSVELLEEWRRMRVKVASVAPELARAMDWTVWQPRLKRYGIVLEMEQIDRSMLKVASLPMIIPFTGQRQPPLPRIVQKVSKPMIPTWEKIANKQDPLLFGGYWLDTIEYQLPRLTTEREARNFLIRMVKARASIPAKVFGVYPQKGALTIGADADLLFVKKDHLLTDAGAAFKPDQTWLLGESIEERSGKPRVGKLLDRHRTYAFFF